MEDPYTYITFKDVKQMVRDDKFEEALPHIFNSGDMHLYHLVKFADSFLTTGNLEHWNIIKSCYNIDDETELYVFNLCNEYYELIKPKKKRS